MKLTKTLSLAAALALLAGAAFAQSYTTKIYKDQNGDRQTVASGGTLRMQAGSVADLTGPTFSTAQTGNPLVQQSYKDFTVSTDLSSAAMATVIASTAARTVYPGGGITIMASGTASGVTGLALECSDGVLIASWPMALLTTNVPVGPFSSSAVTRGAGLTKGCAASTAVMLSTVGGNLVSTTRVYTNVPYTVQ